MNDEYGCRNDRKKAITLATINDATIRKRLENMIAMLIVPKQFNNSRNKKEISC